MSTPKPPEKPQPAPDSEQTSQNADEKASLPKRDGFFDRVRQNLNPETNQQKGEEIVVMDDSNDES
jgi:hypothetical protein